MEKNKEIKIEYLCDAILMPIKGLVENCILEKDGKFKPATRSWLGNKVFDVSISASQYAGSKLQAYQLYLVDHHNLTDVDIVDTGDIVYNKRLECVSMYDNSLKAYLLAGELHRVIATTNKMYGLAKPDDKFLLEYCKRGCKDKEVLVSEAVVQVRFQN